LETFSAPVIGSLNFC